MKKNFIKKYIIHLMKHFKGILFDGMTIMSGGFGLCGLARKFILAIKKSGVLI